MTFDYLTSLFHHSLCLKYRKEFIFLPFMYDLVLWKIDSHPVTNTLSPKVIHL